MHVCMHLHIIQLLFFRVSSVCLFVCGVSKRKTVCIDKFRSTVMFAILVRKKKTNEANSKNFFFLVEI